MSNLKISYKMTGKLEGINALSTNTLSNSFCKFMYKSKDKNCICKYCYSYYMLNTFRKTCVKAYEHNSKILSSCILKDSELPEIKNQLFFRFNAHGEIINEYHFINLLNICNKNPLTTFVLWSKKHSLIKNVLESYNKPKNLILVYSEPIIDKIVKKTPNKYFDKVFNVVTKDNKKINCNKKCIDCLICYQHNNVSCIVEKIKPYGKKKDNKE